MIRLCDKESYIVEQNAMTRLEMINFFLNGHRHDVLQLVEEDMSRVGIVTYEDLIDERGVVRICTKEFVMSENFWDEARDFFRETDLNLAPVYDTEGNILGFCYDDGEKYSDIERMFEIMEAALEIPLFIRDVYPKIEQVCIYECNEYAYMLYDFLKKMEFPVCVIGEKWNWFGIKTLEGIYDYPEYAKINVYAEGSWQMYDGREYEVSRSDELLFAFDFLKRILRENVKYIKEKYIGKLLEKKVNLCQVILPGSEQVDFFTDLEKESTRIGDVSEFADNYRHLGKEKKELLYEIYGKEILEEFHQKGIWSELALNPESSKKVNTKRSIYLFGNCIVGGYAVKERESLPVHLQEFIGEAATVVPCMYNWIDFIRLEAYMKEIPIREQDIIVFVDEDESAYGNGTAGRNESTQKNKSEIKTFFLREYYRNENRGTWFGCIPIHSNALGNRKIAEAVYNDFLKEMLNEAEKGGSNGFIQKGELLSEDNRGKIKEYLTGIDRFTYDSKKKTGSIVMNCNPFTLGHRYLIEYAASKVDYLYVFVVEEDRSEFEFNDRFKMVQEGTKHLKNVSVNPSGNFILSYETLQIYFGKSKWQEKKVDADTDLQIFARYIAPELGISCRFVGEEPLDKITKQYNEQMKEILKLFGIEVCEISRKTVDGQIISASAVRKALENEDYETVRKMVPESTWKIIINTEHKNCKI